tara:strand:- start:353 stop:565 length:213 start_codon:yes stop_codon:yes gene_type:complete
MLKSLLAIGSVFNMDPKPLPIGLGGIGAIGRGAPKGGGAPICGGVGGIGGIMQSILFLQKLIYLSIKLKF